MKVLITDNINKCVKDIISETAEAVFLPTMSEEEIIKIIGEYDALMVRSQTKVNRNIIEAGKKLKIIGRAGVGVDNIDVNSATEKGIIVVNSPDGNTIAASEHTIALMLAISRNIVPASQSTKEGKWNRDAFTGTELFGKTLGVMGFGRIGRKVVNIALSIGMKVIVYDPFANEETVNKACALYETSSHHSVEVSTPGHSTAICENQLSALAPCQCFTFAGIVITPPSCSDIGSLPSS